LVSSISCAAVNEAATAVRAAENVAEEIGLSSEWK
jgi:hypothetical protein